jgi:hypothetical protein
MVPVSCGGGGINLGRIDARFQLFPVTHGAWDPDRRLSFYRRLAIESVRLRRRGLLLTFMPVIRRLLILIISINMLSVSSGI